MLYWSAISLGLVSSLHCLGMCGPLVLMFQNGTQHTGQALRQALTYNFGRITTYVLIGLFFGLLGQGLILSQTQRYVAVACGILLFGGALLGLPYEKYFSTFPLFRRWNQYLQAIFGRWMTQGKSRFYFGLLNGLLPCGMVYLALAGSLSMPTIETGAAFMFSFGLGTLPAMAAPFLFQHGLRQRLRPYLPWIQRTAMLTMGILLIIRGLQIELPAQLSWLEMLNNPVMCH